MANRIFFKLISFNFLNRITAEAILNLRKMNKLKQYAHPYNR